MIKRQLQLLSLSVLFSLSPLLPAEENNESKCDGPFKGKKITEQQKTNIIEAHYLFSLNADIYSDRNYSTKRHYSWLERGKHYNWREERKKAHLPLPENGLAPRVANLCKAVLRGNLKEANLRSANLQNADPSAANQSKASFAHRLPAFRILLAI